MTREPARNEATAIAVDLGAESGRVVAVSLENGHVAGREVHRFQNRPVKVAGHFHWDVLSLFAEIEAGIDESLAHRPASVGIDTWGVDFALLDGNGVLLGNPWHYRDSRTQGVYERMFERLSRHAIFEETGVQFQLFNTLVQLYSMAEREDPRLKVVETFLMLPDLLHFWLTGRKACEFTIATTSQMLTAGTTTWSPLLLDLLGMDAGAFPEVVMPGTHLGDYRGLQVILPACHDTGSAFMGVPLKSAAEEAVFVSSGTWSLVGTEIPAPITSREAMEANVTSEGTANGGYRLVKNVMGLWIMQQCRQAWNAAGLDMSYADLAAAAEKEPALRSVVPVDHPDFWGPGDHVSMVQELCRQRGEPVPDTPAAVARCVFDSLALAYRIGVDQLASLTGRKFKVVHVVGGGSSNAALNRAIAHATGLPVLAGPREATALGNGLTQLVALGAIGSFNEARALLADSVPLERFEPQDTERWEAALARVAVR